MFHMGSGPPAARALSFHDSCRVAFDVTSTGIQQEVAFLAAEVPVQFLLDVLDVYHWLSHPDFVALFILLNI